MSATHTLPVTMQVTTFNVLFTYLIFEIVQ